MSAPPPSFDDRVGHRFLRGSVALSAGSWFSSFINFGLNLMLARLLGPSAFGLYAFVFAINEFISIVAAFGIPLRSCRHERSPTSLSFCSR
jgi:O-antigen/teichoic acid export membrane protein